MASPSRRGPETTVTTIGTTRTIARSPGLPPSVRSRLTLENIGDKATLLRLLSEMAREMDAMRIGESSVLKGATFLQGITLANGTNYVEHRLGRTPTGILATLATSAPVSVALPSGYDPARYFAVSNPSAVPVTVNFLVF